MGNLLEVCRLYTRCSTCQTGKCFGKPRGRSSRFSETSARLTGAASVAGGGTGATSIEPCCPKMPSVSSPASSGMMSNCSVETMGLPMSRLSNAPPARFLVLESRACGARDSLRGPHPWMQALPAWLTRVPRNPSGAP